MDFINSSIAAIQMARNYSQTDDPIYTILCPLVGLIGLILNLISLLVMISFKEPLYFYLRLELMFIIVDELITVFKPVYYCRSCGSISGTFFANFYFYVFNVYMASVLELGALLSRNTSSLICFLLLSKRLHPLRFVLKRSSCLLIASIIIFFSFIVYIYQLFEYKVTRVVVRSSSNSSTSNLIYQIEKTSFASTPTKVWLELVVMSFRDAVNVLVLFVFNVSIIVLSRQNLEEQKNELSATSQHRVSRFERYLEYCNNTAMIRRHARKENKQNFMMILTCLNCLIGRLPILFFFLKRNITSINDRNSKFAALMVYSSYVLYFFLYYHSSYKFRKMFNNYFRRFVGLKETIQPTTSNNNSMSRSISVDELPSKKF